MVKQTRHDGEPVVGGWSVTRDPGHQSGAFIASAVKFFSTSKK